MSFKHQLRRVQASVVLREVSYNIPVKNVKKLEEAFLNSLPSRPSFGICFDNKLFKTGLPQTSHLGQPKLRTGANAKLITTLK